MRRTIKARRGDVMHYTGGYCKAAEAAIWPVSPISGAWLRPSCRFEAFRRNAGPNPVSELKKPGRGFPAKVDFT